nr:hypothetical protein [uncultured Halomonas sp.]
MEIFAIFVSLAALGYSIWVRVTTSRDSQKNLNAMKAMEEKMRAGFSDEQLVILDKQFENAGIGRSNSGK